MKRIILKSLVSTLIVVYTFVSFAQDSQLKVSIIYDNYTHNEALDAHWGYACMIEGTEKTILFDTGTKPNTFISNFNKLNLDAQKVDMVVISHEHGDHTGGLFEFLKINNSVPVLFPKSFSDKFGEEVKEAGAKVVLINEHKELCKNVYTSGEMGTRIPEQSLAISTPKGLVVITGCSHPGIIKILEHFKNTLNQDIYMVFGGFHLFRTSESEVSNLITQMKKLGVQKCGATHCTGKKQINQFKKAFGDNYVAMGVGNVIEL